MAHRRVLILGAGGQLGRKVSELFGARSWATIGVDAYSSPSTHTVLSVRPGVGAATTCRDLMKQLHDVLDGAKVDAVVNVAGGFAMGNSTDADMVKNTEIMIKSSLYSSVIAAHVAGTTMRGGGLLILPGAAAALSSTGWSLPYGAAKAAVHHLVRSLADGSSNMPKDSKTIGLAPAILDTPQNRAAMPDADRSDWATLDEVAEMMEEWCAEPSGVVSGKVYVVEKTGGKPATFHARDPL